MKSWITFFRKLNPVLSCDVSAVWIRYLRKQLKEFDKNVVCLCYVDLWCAVFVSQNASFSASWISADPNSRSQNWVRNSKVQNLLRVQLWFTLSCQCERTETRLSWTSAATPSKPSCLMWSARLINMRWERPWNRVSCRNVSRAHTSSPVLGPQLWLCKMGFNQRLFALHGVCIDNFLPKTV